MSKFFSSERNLVKSKVAILSLKRKPDKEIIKEIERQTDKTITTRYLGDIRQQIKKDSYHWYQTLKESQYEYIHEFKERINEISWLQQKHHEIINNNKGNQQIQQTSLAELHRLNLTLSNYFDVAPDILNNGSSIPKTSENKNKTETEESDQSIITV